MYSKFLMLFITIAHFNNVNAQTTDTLVLSKQSLKTIARESEIVTENQKSFLKLSQAKEVGFAVLRGVKFAKGEITLKMRGKDALKQVL